MTDTLTIPGAAAVVRPATVEVQIVRIGSRQMTKAVWNQLPQHLFSSFEGGSVSEGFPWHVALDDALAGYPGRRIEFVHLNFWGIVRDCKCGYMRPGIEHIHVLGTIQPTEDAHATLARFVFQRVPSADAFVFALRHQYEEWPTTYPSFVADLPQLFIAV